MSGIGYYLKTGPFTRNTDMIHDYQMNFYKLIKEQPEELSLAEKLYRIDRLSCQEALQKARTELSPSLAWFYALGSVLLFYYHKLCKDRIKHTEELEGVYSELVELCAYEQRTDVRGSVHTPQEILEKVEYYTHLRRRLIKLLQQTEPKNSVTTFLKEKEPCC